jgi:hypothetical protein
MYLKATAAAKMAAPECTMLSREKMLNILKWSTRSSLAEKILKVNSLQKSMFLILWLITSERTLTSP